MMKKVIAILIAAFACLSLQATDRDSLRVFKTFPFMDKGAIQAGASFTHSSLSSTNAELLLLLNGLDMSGHLTRLNPFVSYSYSKDRAIGLSIKYLSADLSGQSAVVDLLNEGLQVKFDNVRASYTSSGFEFFHRWFTGLDRLGRFGLYYDTALGYSENRLDFYPDKPSDSYMEGYKLSFDFTPGFMMYVLDNVAVHVGINIATLSYSNMSLIDKGEQIGGRTRFQTMLKGNPLGLVYGISIQL
ncbi:MAG: hypothetical protein PUC53_06665 [Bacteroidales bacterium]|nr:hypothetical protein [Bacteroidales bacterium]